MKIYLNGPVSPFKSEGTISLESVQALFNGVEEPVELHINSLGGDVYTSIAICNFLKAFPYPVNIYIDGVCASGASIICTGADKVFAYRNSLFLIHQVSCFVGGNADELSEVVAELRTLDQAVYNSYLEKFKGNGKQLWDIIKRGKMLNAEQSLEYGFIDEILDRVSESAAQYNNDSQLQYYDMTGFLKSKQEHNGHVVRIEKNDVDKVIKVDNGAVTCDKVDKGDKGDTAENVAVTTDKADKGDKVNTVNRVIQSEPANRSNLIHNILLSLQKVNHN